MDDRFRISDADRDRVAALLRDHFAAGRLTLSELDERLTATLGAKTFGDLRRVLADLPGPVPVLQQPSRLPPQASVARRRWIVVALACICALGALGYLLAAPKVYTATVHTGTAAGPTVYAVYDITNGSRGTGAVIPISTAANRAGEPVRVGDGPINIVAGQIEVTPDGKTAYVVNTGGTVVPVSTATNRAGKPIRVARRPPSFGPHALGPDFIAITPDGRTAYVADPGQNTVIPIRTATNTPGQPIHLPKGGYGPAWIAITPNGKTAYVANDSQPGTVTPISTATNQAGKPIRVGGAFPSDIAITPDGKTAYVLGRATSGHTKGKVTPVNTATNTPGKPIYLPWMRGYGSTGLSIAITPDGTTAYASTNYPRTVVPIRTATNTAGNPIKVAGPPDPTGGQIAITPDGTTAYAVVGPNTIVPISTATNTPGPPIRFGSDCHSRLLGGSDTKIAITPDGKTVYAACEGAVVPISTATNTPGKPIRLPLGYPMAITIIATPRSAGDSPSPGLRPHPPAMPATGRPTQA